MTSPDPYEQSGVDYQVLDAAKRIAQHEALLTSLNASRLGAVVDDESRGEPATVIRLGAINLGFVLECLGTKSVLARSYEQQSGVDCFDAIGFDTVAAAVNDCCCVGALPFVVNAYFATGAASFYNGTRHASLVRGFSLACNESQAAWGGGESPTLSGLIDENGIDLAASAVGLVPDGVVPLTGAALRDDDAIVLVASSGLHANGASLARIVGEGLKDGLCTSLASGRAFGEALLDPSVIYVRLVEAALRADVGLHYVSHITGHGLRKLMRANRELTYVIDTLLPVPEVLSFVAERAQMSSREAYGTFNMGAGFALFVDHNKADEVVRLATTLGYAAVVAGRIENGPRRVVLDPLGVVFEGTELELR